MGNVVSNIIGAVIMISVSIYMWKILLDKKINFKSYRLYLATLCAIPLILINYFYNSSFIKIPFITIALIICNKILFSESNDKTVISTVIGQIVINFSDILFGLILIGILRFDPSFILHNIFGSLIGNLCVSLLSIIIIRFKFIIKIYNKLLDISGKVKIFSLVNFGVLLIVSINLLMAFIYYKVNAIYIIIVNLFLFIIYSFILYKSIAEKNNNILIKAKNDSLMESLHQYEDMVDRQRVDNHENKNQLLIIKNMINKNDKDVVKYLDSIIKDKKQDDEALYNRVKTIPSGGLQGIIYQKMLVMKDERIVFSLDVSRDVREINLNDFSVDNNYKLCKIIGVLLDNAIEESRNIKDKCIMISIYIDEDNLIIDISNRFNNEIDIDKIDDEGYTTKGDGHGYGLSLVKKIVTESNIFENERIVKKDIFKQIIKVKIKNT